MTTELLRTPLHDWHVAHGGRMVDFAGWSMPVQYRSIAEEHKATRNAVGVFDISHMGRLNIGGSETAEFLDSLVTREVQFMKPGQVRYSLVCNEDGGILDDILVYRLSIEEASAGKLPSYRLVVNASNRHKILDWLDNHQHSNIVVGDNTRATAMIAIQGPAAIALIAPLVDCEPGKMRYYTSQLTKFRNQQILISRTGYTGEDGCEIICGQNHAVDIWETILNEGKSVGATAVGLGARDTLRLEAAMPLYGHELSEEINPCQAGLNFAVNLNAREFVGRDALDRYAADKLQSVRVGLNVDGKRVPRQGCPITYHDRVVGEVTSGTFSPTFERSIAMAYVRPSAAAIDTQLTVDIRGTQHQAVVVQLPFYKRPKDN